MFPRDTRTSHYRTAVLRSLRRRKAALAAIAVLPGLACSTYDDAETFRSATTVPAADNSIDTATDIDATGTSAPGTASEAPNDTAAATVPATAPTVDSQAEATAESTEASPSTAPETVQSSESAFVSGAELAVSFTFTPTAGGRRIENPFIAVWVEDTEGNLVRTISLWYEQHEESPEWLAHLTQWTSATNLSIDATTSSATRIPGEYTVTWDGVGDDGAIIEDGEYVLFVEAARRGGAYDITSTPISVNGDGFAIDLSDSGELTAVSAELVA